MATCTLCGASYEPYRSSARYCTRRCYWRARDSRRAGRTVKAAPHMLLPCDAAAEQSAVAAKLGITRQGVQKIEERALEKLRRNPLVRALWQEMKS